MPVPAGGLIDRDSAKDAVGWSNRATQDALFDSLIQAATPIIERICGPVLPTTKTVRLSGGKSAVLLPDRLASDAAVTSVVEGGTATADYFVDGNAGIVYAGSAAQGRSFADGRRNITVTYTVGYDEIPATIQLAARELVRLWWQQSVSSDRPSFDDAGQSDSVTVPQGFAVPRKVRELLAPYQRPAGFA